MTPWHRGAHAGAASAAGGRCDAECTTLALRAADDSTYEARRPARRTELRKLSRDCHQAVAPTALFERRSQRADGSMLKFLVFSDLHLVDTDETSLGLDTHRRFGAGVDWANAHHADADFCVLAGDLADLGFKGATEPYQRLKDQVERLTMPCHITIGNHDNRDAFVSCFGDAMRAETGCIDTVVDAKGHRTILLDSVVEDEGVDHTDRKSVV